MFCLRLFSCFRGIFYCSVAPVHYSAEFKDIFISERLGADKPSKEFFDLAFSRIEGFERDKAIIVGDRLSSDILGGINAGIKTCWFNPKGLPVSGDIRPDCEIHALFELPELLEKL